MGYIDRDTLQQADELDHLSYAAPIIRRVRDQVTTAGQRVAAASGFDLTSHIKRLSAGWDDGSADDQPSEPAASPARPSIGDVTSRLSAYWSDGNDAASPPADGGLASPYEDRRPAASGTPSAMPGSADTDDDEEYIRQAAARRGIDPQKAVDVANTEGGAGRIGRARQNSQGAPAFSHFQLYVGGPGNPGLGDEALAAGIDPRDPSQWKQAVDFALDHAARKGWGAFQGAAAAGIGAWDGIGGEPVNFPSSGATRSGSGQNAPAAASPSSNAGDWTPNQYEVSKAEGLDDETAWAVCGPAAAIAFARRTGRNPSMREAIGLARQVGWTADAGMAGPSSQRALLERMGIASRLEEGAPDWRKVAADVQRGNPVTISTDGHYFVAERYDPDTGTFDFGNSAAVLRASGGRRWFRPEEIASLGMGAPRAALYLDNPAPPTPSVAADQRSGAMWSPDGPSSGPVASQAPTGRSGGGGVMMRQGLAALYEVGNTAAEYDSRDVDSGPRESQPAYDPRDADQGPHEQPYPGTVTPIQNPNGSITTERSITVTEPGLNGGRPTNIPTVWSGRVVSDDEAIDNAINSGRRWPSYNTIDEAVSAAEERTNDLGSRRATSVGGAEMPRTNYTYQMADGRTAEPTPTGVWEAWQTVPRPAAEPPVRQDPPNPYGAPRSIAADTNPSAAPDYGDGGAARRAAQADLDRRGVENYQTATSTPGEPDYVAPRYRPLEAADAPRIAGQVVRAATDAAQSEWESIKNPTAFGIASRILGGAVGPGTQEVGAIVVAAINQFGDSVGRRVAQALGMREGEFAHIREQTIAGIQVPEIVLTNEDVAGLVGSILLDPSNAVGAGEARPVARAAGRAAREVAEAAPEIASEASQVARRAGSAMAEEGARQLLDLTPVARVVPPGEGGLPNTARALTQEEADTVVGYMAIRHDALNSPRVADAFAGLTPDEIRQTLRAWHAQGVFPEVRDVRALDEEITSALAAAERESQGRRVDPAMERGGYGRRYTGDDVDASPMSGTPAENRRFGDDGYTDRMDPGTTAPPEIPRTVDDVPRQNSVTANATPGITPSARLVSDLGNSVGGGVMGAATGYALPADSEEQRRQNALTGAGVGMVAGPVAGRMMPRSGGALATFGTSPNYRGPSATQLRAAEQAGTQRGARLNREVQAPGSAVPARVRAATAATDDRAALRWAEDMLSDAAGNPRMRENDPMRPSTQSRINAGSIADERITNELEPAIVKAGEAGLQHELPQYLEDVHARDVLDEFYNRGYQAEVQAQQQRIANAQANGASAVTIRRMQANIQPRAEASGERAMRKRQGNNPEHAYEVIDARLQAQETRLQKDGRWQTLQDSAQAVWDHNAETRRRMVDAGLLDPAEATYYEQAYPHYVPTRPISHLDPANGTGPVASSTGPRVSAGRQKPVHALDEVGTSGERLNPIVASRNSTVRAERQIQRNNTAAAFAQMMDDALQASPSTMATGADHRTFLGGGVDVTYWANGKPVTIGVPKAVADGLESAAQMGADPGTVGRIWKRIMGVFSSAMTAGRASFLPVNLTRDLQDYAIRTAANEGGPHKLPAVMGTWLDEAGKAVADIARAQATVRGGAGAAMGAITGAAVGDEDTTPAERARHAAEGALAGTFLLGANKVKATGKAREYLARGGGSGGQSAHWKAGQRWYRDVLKDGGAVVASPADAARYLGDWLHDVATLQGITGINERTELISRTAAMRRGDAQKLDATEAMIRGRDASYDPDRAGTVARLVNGIVPFFNATVQNGAQFTRLLKQNPVAAPASLAATVAPAMLALEAWNRSDPGRAEVYDDVPQYVKDSGLVAVLPWAGSDNRGDRPNYLWIPSGVQTPFIMGMRRAMENLPGLEPTAGAVGDRPDASTAEKWGNTLADIVMAFSPLRGDSASSLASNVVPQGAKQVLELGINKDLYRGNPVMTDMADERASAASRGVAGAANAVGRAVGSDFLQNVRPSGVEHLVNALPAYGDIVKGASDLVAPSGYKQAEDRPVQNEPFVGGIAGRFVRDNGGANLQRAQDAAMSDSVRDVVSEAGMRPSELDLSLPAEYKKAPLTREEQVRWQEIFNRELPRAINEARRGDQWRNPSTREEAVKKAVSTARQNAAERARLPNDQQIENRIRKQQSMKAS